MPTRAGAESRERQDSARLGATAGAVGCVHVRHGTAWLSAWGGGGLHAPPPPPLCMHACMHASRARSHLARVHNDFALWQQRRGVQLGRPLRHQLRAAHTRLQHTQVQAHAGAAHAGGVEGMAAARPCAPGAAAALHTQRGRCAPPHICACPTGPGPRLGTLLNQMALCRKRHVRRSGATAAEALWRHAGAPRLLRRSAAGGLTCSTSMVDAMMSGSAPASSCACMSEQQRHGASTPLRDAGQRPTILPAPTTLTTLRPRTPQHGAGSFERLVHAHAMPCHLAHLRATTVRRCLTPLGRHGVSCTA